MEAALESAPCTFSNAMVLCTNVFPHNWEPCFWGVPEDAQRIPVLDAVHVIGESAWMGTRRDAVLPHISGSPVLPTKYRDMLAEHLNRAIVCPCILCGRKTNSPCFSLQTRIFILTTNTLLGGLQLTHSHLALKMIHTLMISIARFYIL